MQALDQRMLPNHPRRKEEEVRGFVLPASGRQPGLEAHFVEESGSVPSLFDGDLRQQDPFGLALPHYQSVVSNANLLPVRDFVEGREHGNFILQAIQLPCANRAKARVAESGEHGDVSDFRAMSISTPCSFPLRRNSLPCEPCLEVSFVKATAP